jgi:hypothetical protein
MSTWSKAGYEAEHILTVPAADNVVRLLPALTISDDDISDKAITRLDAAATTVSERRKRPPPSCPSSFRLNTVRGECEGGRQPPPHSRRFATKSDRPMKHFLDIHKTDATDLRSHDRSRPPQMKTARAQDGPRARPTPRNPSPVHMVALVFEKTLHPHPRQL